MSYNVTYKALEMVGLLVAYSALTATEDATGQYALHNGIERKVD